MTCVVALCRWGTLEVIVSWRVTRPRDESWGWRVCRWYGRRRGYPVGYYGEDVIFSSTTPSTEKLWPWRPWNPLTGNRPFYLLLHINSQYASTQNQRLTQNHHSDGYLAHGQSHHADTATSPQRARSSLLLSVGAAESIISTIRQQYSKLSKTRTLVCQHYQSQTATAALLDTPTTDPLDLWTTATSLESLRSITLGS